MAPNIMSILVHFGEFLSLDNQNLVKIQQLLLCMYIVHYVKPENLPP